MPESKNIDEKKIIVKTPEEEKSRAEQQMIAESLIRMVEHQKIINARLDKLEKAVAGHGQVVRPLTTGQPQPQQQKSKVDINAIAALAPLITGSQSNPMDTFFKQLGERVFMKTVDKWIPSGKELRKGEKIA